MDDQKENRGMKELRGLLFPAIGINIITGFNVYPTDNSTCEELNQIKISYLHEDILEGKLHYMQIKDMLQKYCDQIKTQRIEHEAITRSGTYRLEEGWEAAEYFLIDQTPVKPDQVNDLIRQNITVIGCAPQNELIIKCEKKDMNYILEQFRLYANKYQIDPVTGEFCLNSETNEPVLNSNKLWDKAWDLPVILLTGPELEEVKTYAKARKISFDTENGIASLIIGNKWNNAYSTDEIQGLAIPSFEDYLRFRNTVPDNVDNNYFTNRAFFDWINEISWQRVKKTIDSHRNLFES